MAAALADVDAVRLLCGDSCSDAQVLSDIEVQFFIDEHGGNRYEAAAACADAIAARYANRVDVRAGILSSSDSQLSAQHRQLAKDLRARAAVARTAGAIPYAGGLSVSDKQAGRDAGDMVQPAFVRPAVLPSGDEELC